MSWLKVRKGQENTGRKTGFRTSSTREGVFFLRGYPVHSWPVCTGGW